MLASSLAYGRVSQILKSVSHVLERMGPSPRAFVERAERRSLEDAYGGFKHRFSDDVDLIDLILGMRDVIRIHGSLDGALALSVMEGKTGMAGVRSFVNLILRSGRRDRNTLLPRPDGGSACKRLMLYLRWMVRYDEVDPGGWTSLSPSDLVVPLDTHMHRISLSLGFTRRKSGDMRTAEDITAFFRSIRPDDPVRYDFALTRFGIRSDMDVDDLIGSMQDREEEGSPV